MNKVQGVAYIDEQKFNNIVKCDILDDSHQKLMVNFFNEEPKYITQKIKEINEKENLGKKVVVLTGSYFKNKETMSIHSELSTLYQNEKNVVIVEDYAHLSPNTQNLLLSLGEKAKAQSFYINHPESARLLGAGFRGHTTHYGVELDNKPQHKMKF